VIILRIQSQILNRQNSLIVENYMLTNEYTDTTNLNHEMNSTNEFDRDDNKNFILNNDDRNEDRYRDDGIFV